MHYVNECPRVCVCVCVCVLDEVSFGFCEIQSCFDFHAKIMMLILILVGGRSSPLHW